MTKDMFACIFTYSWFTSGFCFYPRVPHLPDTEGGTIAAVLRPFSPTRVGPLSSLEGVSGRTQKRLPPSEIWEQFRNTICSLLALLGLSAGPFTTQIPKADQ